METPRTIQIKNLKEEIFIKHLDGPLFFGFTADFQKLSAQIPETASHVIIRMDKVPYIDQSGLYALEDTILELRRQEIEIHLVSLQKQPELLLRQIDIIPDLISEECIHDDFDHCIDCLKEIVEDIY